MIAMILCVAGGGAILGCILMEGILTAFEKRD